MEIITSIALIISLIVLIALNIKYYVYCNYFDMMGYIVKNLTHDDLWTFYEDIEKWHELAGLCNYEKILEAHREGDTESISWEEFKKEIGMEE